VTSLLTPWLVDMACTRRGTCHRSSHEIVKAVELS
jgi:hypothetical protein